MCVQILQIYSRVCCAEVDPHGRHVAHPGTRLVPICLVSSGKVVVLYLVCRLAGSDKRSQIQCSSLLVSCPIDRMFQR